MVSMSSAARLPRPRRRLIAYCGAIAPQYAIRRGRVACSPRFDRGWRCHSTGYRDQTRSRGSRLARLLFPVTIVSEATIEAANAAEPSDNVLRLAVAEQSTIMRRRLAARLQR
jgi:hypothetical protein